MRVAQPALSRHIKLLEHELRVELFVRNGRGMLLTSAGRMLLDRTTGSSVRSNRSATTSNRRTAIRRAASSSGWYRRSARCCPAGLPAASSTNFLTSRCASWRAMAAIWSRVAPRRNGSRDHLRPCGRSASSGPVRRPRGYRRCRSAGFGVSKRKQVDLKWLVKQKLILPSISHGLRALLEKALAREKLKIEAMIEVDSYRAQISLMEEGLGYTLLPPSAIRTEVAAKRLEMARRQPLGVARTDSRLADRPSAVDRNDDDCSADRVRNSAALQGRAVEDQHDGVARTSLRHGRACPGIHVFAITKRGCPAKARA